MMLIFFQVGAKSHVLCEGEEAENSRRPCVVLLDDVGHNLVGPCMTHDRERLSEIAAHYQDLAPKRLVDASEVAKTPVGTIEGLLRNLAGNQ